jgi:hypothetical protein
MADLEDCWGMDWEGINMDRFSSRMFKINLHKSSYMLQN